jgi:hypothetical protein
MELYGVTGRTRGKRWSARKILRAERQAAWLGRVEKRFTGSRVFPWFAVACFFGLMFGVEALGKLVDVLLGQ